MALAIHTRALVDRGEVADYAELARLAHVSRPRITQIMDLTLLAPDVQEAILFLPVIDGKGRGVGDSTRGSDDWPPTGVPARVGSLGGARFSCNAEAAAASQ